MKNRKGLLRKAVKIKKKQNREYYKLVKSGKNAEVRQVKNKKVEIFIYKLKYTLFWFVILLFLSGIMSLIITIIAYILKIY